MERVVWALLFAFLLGVSYKLHLDDKAMQRELTAHLVLQDAAIRRLRRQIVKSTDTSGEISRQLHARLLELEARR